MDVDFLVQDTFSLVRPQWKLAADLHEAAYLFGEAVSRNYNLQESEKTGEAEDDDIESRSSEGPADDGLEEDVVPDADEEQSTSEEAEVGCRFFTCLVAPNVSQGIWHQCRTRG
jgi:regulator of nonsense transcripts 2